MSEQNALGFDLSRQNIDRALNTIADEAILSPRGLIARNYERSGLKSRSGAVVRGITSRTQGITYVGTEGNTVKVGANIEAYQYKEGTYGQGGGRISMQMLLGILIYGHKEIRPRMRKVLRFQVGGRWVFAKRVRAAAGHPHLYEMTPEADAKSDDVAADVLMGVR